MAVSLPLVLLAACESSAAKAEKEAALAQLMLDQGNLSIAQAAIGRALALGGNSADILLLDARIKVRADDLRGAFDAYRTVLVFQPDNREALTVVAQTGAILGQKDAARDAIGKMIASEPDNPEALMTLGVLALQDDNFTEALRHAERLLLSSPGDPRGLALKARALSQMDRGDEALALLRAQIERTGNNSTMASALLEVARNRGDAATMLEQFPLLIQAYPRSTDLPLDEINTRYKTGDNTGARAAARDFIVRFGANSTAMARLVSLWEEYDSQPLSAPDLAALATNGAIEARLAASRFYFDRRNPAAAEALVASSPDARARGLRTRIQIRRGDERAVPSARAIVEADKTNCEALSAMAEWHLARGRSDAAVIPAQVVATQCRDRIDGFVILANAYQRANRPPAVERAWRDGIDAHPQNPQLARLFGQWMLSRGRSESAIATARRLTTVAPARESSWRVLAALCQRARDTVCAGDAARGLARAKTNYQLDPLPGVRPPDPLFGRTWR